jgi:hypothetical protein
MLHELLQEALKKKLISSKAFTHIRGIRQTAALDLRRMRRFEGLRKSQLPKSDYLAILQKAIPRLRNAYAHPTGQAIHLPHARPSFHYDLPQSSSINSSHDRHEDQGGF